MTSAKHFALSALALAALVAGSAPAASAQTAVQTVKFEVLAINRIAVSGTPTLTIRANPGQTTSVTSTAATWSVTTNQTGAKVTAALAEPMPEGLTLALSLAAPAGATSTGLQPLGTTPVNVVTNVSRLSAANLAMTYQLDANVGAGTNLSGTRAVMLTITGGV
jgi:opacity protein-like surface antigen